MIVELISIGTELLMGSIINTNANYLSIQCANPGFLCIIRLQLEIIWVDLVRP